MHVLLRKVFVGKSFFTADIVVASSRETCTHSRQSHHALIHRNELDVHNRCAMQVWLNYQRQSTLGWNINQVLLDLTGGVFSVFQLCMEAYAKEDMSAITGDPVKFGLGSVSIVFDVMFIVQHYWLYKLNNAKLSEDAPKGYTMVTPDQLDVSQRHPSASDEQRLLASATTSVSEEGVSRSQLSHGNSMSVESLPQSPPNEPSHEV